LSRVSQLMPMTPLDADAGFSSHFGVFSADEMSSLADALGGVGRTRAGARHLMGVPAVSAVARDPRLLALARQALGPSAFPYRATLFDKSSTANWLVVWHQDTALPLQARADIPDWGPWSTKAGVLYAHAPGSALEKVVALRVHIDPSTHANGPLRVVPGSHRLGVLSDEAIRRLADRSTAHECTLDAGGVLRMRPLLVHSSSKTLRPASRRVIHIEYAASLDIGSGVALHVA